MLKKFTLFVSVILVTLAGLAQPLNDVCISATPIVIPSSGNICITSSTATATSTTWTNPICGQSTWTNDVWFSFVSNGSLNTITVRPTGSPAAQQVGVAVWTGNCANLTSVGTACNIAATAGGTATVTQASPAGTTYYVEVSSFTAAGGFELCINSITPPPSPGSSCATAAVVCDLSSFTLANGPAGTGNYDPGCFLFGASSSLWYQFSVGTSGTLAWSATPNAAGTELDWAVFDITNGCGTVNLNNNTVACNYNYNNELSSPIGMSPTSVTACPAAGAAGAAGEFCPSITVQAGRTYAIFIDNFSNNNSGWDFNWTGSTFQMSPTSAFTLNTNRICGTSGSVTITNNSVGAASQVWDFGDGSPTFTGANPGTHNYTSPGTYLVSLVVTSATGCTDVSSQSIQIIAPPVVTTVSDTICTGGQATISASANPSGGTYTWNPGGFNTASVNVSPGATTTYTVTYNSTDNCTASATAIVTVNSGNFTVNAGADTTICGNQAINLNGSVTPAGTYTYQWTGGTITNATTLTPTVSPVITTTYTLSVTSAGGCSRTDDVQVIVNGIAVPVTVTATPSVICPGQQVQLAASILPVSCGASPTCLGNNITNSIGSGTVVQPGTSLQPPTLFGNFLKSGRNQMLYTAAELGPALGSACIIKALTFNIAVFNSNAFLQNFTIKMACTNATSLTNWEQNLITVYTAANYQPQAGWLNGISLTSPFSWDGVSNIVVDICWNNPSTFGNQNNKAECTNTGVNTYLYNFSSAADMCGTTTAPTASNLRPNVRFNYCLPNLNNYTITWSPAPGAPNGVSAQIDSPTTAPSVTTTYNVSVSNGPTCPGLGAVTVQVDNSSVSAGPDINSCPNAPVNLTATVTGTVLPGPASFVWTTLAGAAAGTGQTVTVTPAVNTTYVVTMNGGACVRRDTVTVNIGSITATATPTNVTCFGANNGFILAGSPQGTAPYSYQWSANAATGNTNPASNLAPGSYQVTVSDVNGCSGSATATITQPTQLTLATTTINDSCFAGGKGSITANPSGGTGAYTYAWSNGPTTQTNPALIAGNYSVTVRDANLCSVTASIVVTEPAQVNFVSATIQDVRCYNESTGRITVVNNGGTTPYAYTWAPGVSSTTATANNLAAGNYTVTVRDAYQCTASATYTVTQPATGLAFAPSVVNNPSCFGYSDGSATVNAAGGAGSVSYLWTPSGQTTATATNLSAQTYTVVATDDSSCTATTTVTPVNPPQLQINGVVTDVSCFGGTDGAINVTVNNAVPTASYQWFSGQNTEDLAGITAGNYNVTVTDGNSCTAISSFVVNEPAALIINQPTITNVACFGESTGSVSVNFTGGTGPFTYTWSPAGPNSPTYSGITSGNYDITITDDNGCSASAAYTVNEPATPLSFGAATVVDVLCNGAATGSITVAVSGGTTTNPYTYAWSAPASSSTATASNLTAGQYTVTVTDANGCTLTQTNTVAQPTAVTFGAPNVTNVSCNGGNDGTAAVTPTGGTGSYSYTWNGTPGTNPQAGLTANTYTVVVTDGNNCTFSTTVVVTEPAAIVLAPVATDATCFGAPNGSVDANPTGGTQPYGFVWSNGDAGQIIFGLQAGLYRVTVTDGNGCTASAGANVNEPFPLSFNLHAEQVKCPGDVNGSIEVLSPAGGTPPYNYSATPDGANFYFPSNGTKIGGLASGYYAVIMSDGNGCTLVDTAFVPAPISDVYGTSTDSTSCYGPTYADGAIFVQGYTIQNSPYQFSVDGRPLQYSGDFYGLTAGPHTVLAVNYFGCDTTFTVVVPEPADAFAEALPGDTTLALGQSVQLGSTFGPYPYSTIVGYNWSPTNGLSCTDCPDPVVTTYARQTQYELTITYNGTCTTKASLTINVEGAEPFFVPNSFSPNGDGNNDLFQVYGVGIKTIDLKIFNRWGELIYQSNNQFDGWDGTYKGELQPPGVYVYNVFVTYLNDKREQKVGSITILR